MITVRDFKEFLAEGDNYNLVIRAAEEAAKAGARKYEDYTNYRKCLYDVLTIYSCCSIMFLIKVPVLDTGGLQEPAKKN